MLLSFSSSKAKLTSVFLCPCLFVFFLLFIGLLCLVPLPTTMKRGRRRRPRIFMAFPFSNSLAPLPQSGNVSPILLQLSFLFFARGGFLLPAASFCCFSCQEWDSQVFLFFAKYNLWIDLFEKCCFLHYCSQIKQYSKTKVPLANPYFWHFFVVPPPHYRAAGRKSGGTNFKLFSSEAWSEKCFFPLHPNPISLKGLLRPKRDRKNCGLKDHANRRPILRNPQKKQKPLKLSQQKYCMFQYFR